MGANFLGQSGNGNNDQVNIPEKVADNVTAIAAGALHSLFIKSDGSLWTMGYALDLSYSLFPANWVAQATNKSDPNGVVIFTNTPSVTTNNFCRIRSDF